MTTNNNIPLLQLRLPAFLLLVFALILIGCGDDDCDFTPPPASLTVTITAYSLEDGSVLYTRQETISAQTDDGTLPAQEKTYASPDVEGYLLADDQTVQLPAVGPGQQMHFSVSFFLPSVQSLVEKSETKVISSTPVSTETDEVINFTFIPGKAEVIEFPIKVGCRITNMEEVEKYIDGLFPKTRGEVEDPEVDEKIAEKRRIVEKIGKSVLSVTSPVYIPSINATLSTRKIKGVITPEEGLPSHLQPTVKEENEPDEEEENPGTATPIEISRKYITANEVLRFEVDIEGKRYAVENIKVEVVRTEITFTYLNAGSNGQIGDWKPVTGEGTVD